MRDFSLMIYKQLMEEFLFKDYKIYSFKDYLTSDIVSDKFLILRHDVDKKPINSLNKAQIEKDLGISSTYYFRIVKESYDVGIIKTIKELGHEIGYHYEELSLTNGNQDQAIKIFEYNLDKLNQYYPIKTICAHGSPLSKWNNLDIWKNYKYKNYGIIGEPNFDLDFKKIFYLTDTGMMWNQEKYSVRDLSKGNFKININSTNDIIKKLKDESLPNKIMINTHPQRWSDNNAEWVWELCTQVVKNQLKRIIKVRNRRSKNVN